MKVPTRPDMSLPELSAPPEEKLLEPPHPHHNKFFILLLIVFFGVGIFMLFFTLHDAKEKKVYPVTQMTTITPLPTNPQNDWQTFTNITSGYSIKYPRNYILTPPGPESPDPESLSIQAADLPANNTFILKISPKEVPGIIVLPQSVPTIKLCPTDSITAKQNIGSIKNASMQNCVENPKFISQLVNNGMLYTITVDSPANYDDIKKYVDEILSTITFIKSNVTSPSPANNTGNTSVISTSPNGKACTDEAKECPDGSWVGRTGPNCTFAPCPGK